MLKRLIARWQGVLLTLVGIVATVWLGATGQLGLYIHPRYFWFSIAMALIGAVFVVAAFAFTPLPEEPDEATDAAAAPGLHDHSHHDTAEPPRGNRAGTVRAALAALTIVVATGALLVLPPTTLTSATATQRSINSATSALDASSPTLVGGDTANFTVKDWALLLRQNPDVGYYADKDVDVVGFVTASPDDPENVFYLARFSVTCCAVDAQPIGVPVYLPGWQEQFEEDQWLAATGAIEQNPGSTGDEPLVLVTETLEVTEQPEQPYVF
ncbi:TIGR03943 family putative permease subunit [Agromyces albus]|uniref:TIGR03943 family putative permease subunit n=1 Tax=Agromyces albus TaxID=205332 RepID=UPI00278867D2|nr:TIGR03943 family protein [Agromyces albus]MDQ0576595.1 putative membrane protein [Agromyces albus]